MNIDIENSGEEQKEETCLWNKEYDEYLNSLVQIYGLRNWQIIAESFNNKFPMIHKSASQCKSRWAKEINSRAKDKTWNEKDRYMLLEAHRLNKNSWSKIACLMKKTTSNKIKNRFYTLFRKIKNKIKNSDFVSDSQIDYLETLYVITLIEEYCDKNKEVSALEKTKDYIYKLIENLDLNIIEQYKNTFINTNKQYGNMNEVFDKFAETYGKKIRSTKEEEENKLKCNDIDLKEEQDIFANCNLPITLPEPNPIKPLDGISPEEKEGIWKNVFAKREPITANQQGNNPLSGVSPMSIQPFSANSSSFLRDDEFKGFSQIASACVSNENIQSIGIYIPLVIPNMSANLLKK